MIVQGAWPKESMRNYNDSGTRRSSRTASLLVALVLAGCGGSSHHTAAKGRIKFTVTWPTNTGRVIPVNAQSLVVQVKRGATIVTSGLISRPAATISFSEVPTGSLNVVATAFASVDGTGTPLATATVPTTITSGGTSNVDVTLASTVDHLAVVPSPFSLAALASGTINVVAYDASGAVVLLDPSALSFTSSNPSLVSVTSTGVATAGSSLGSGTISIVEADSGKTLSLPINVVTAVSVSPAVAVVPVGGNQTFAATVVGPANTAVTWSVQEGAFGGTVTSGGVYTAPSAHGTFHVVATSAYDPTRTATATVTVASGNLGVTVH